MYKITVRVLRVPPSNIANPSNARKEVARAVVSFRYRNGSLVIVVSLWEHERWPSSPWSHSILLLVPPGKHGIVFGWSRAFWKVQFVNFSLVRVTLIMLCVYILFYVKVCFLMGGLNQIAQLLLSYATSAPPQWCSTLFPSSLIFFSITALNLFSPARNANWDHALFFYQVWEYKRLCSVNKNDFFRFESISFWLLIHQVLGRSQMLPVSMWAVFCWARSWWEDRRTPRQTPWQRTWSGYCDN